MEKMRWYYRNGTTYEEYTALYRDSDFLLVQNDNTQKYSFGLARDFGSFLGFPVNQSCLTKTAALRQLSAFIRIDKQYIPSLGDIARNNIKRWRAMQKAIKQEVQSK